MFHTCFAERRLPTSPHEAKSSTRFFEKTDSINWNARVNIYFQARICMQILKPVNPSQFNSITTPSNAIERERTTTTNSSHPSRRRIGSLPNQISSYQVMCTGKLGSKSPPLHQLHIWRKLSGQFLREGLRLTRLRAAASIKPIIMIWPNANSGVE